MIPANLITKPVEFARNNYWLLSLPSKIGDSINVIYSKRGAKELSIDFSFWNIGEALGAIDQYCKKRWITRRQHEEAVKALAGETLRLMLLDALNTVPVNSSLLSECWDLIEKYHIYQADALQILSCKRSHAEFFLSADKSLLDAATEENIPNMNVENFDEAKAKTIASSKDGVLLEANIYNPDGERI